MNHRQRNQLTHADVGRDGGIRGGDITHRCSDRSGSAQFEDLTRGQHYRITTSQVDQSDRQDTVAAESEEIVAHPDTGQSENRREMPGQKACNTRRNNSGGVAHLCREIRCR